MYAYVTQPLMRGRCLHTTNRAWEDLMTKNTIPLCHWKRHHILLLLVRHVANSEWFVASEAFFFLFFSNPKGTLGLFYWWYFNFGLFFFWFVFVLDYFVEVLFAFNFIIQSQFCNILFFSISSWLFYLIFFGYFVKLIFLFNLTLQSNFFLYFLFQFWFSFFWFFWAFC